MLDSGPHPRGRLGLTFSGLLPHPPIVVPAVGRERGEDCRRTTDACRELAALLVASAPEHLVLVSPHSPRRRGAFGWWGGGRLRGDLGRFGAPRSRVDLPGDEAFLAALRQRAEGHGLPLWKIDEVELDHGAVVPLWFLVEAGWEGPTTVLSLPWPETSDELESGELVLFGRTVAKSAAALGEPWALVASGDMTHRAKRGAPGGYHPRAVEFDELVESHVARGALEDLLRIPAELRELAGEDVVASSVLVAAAHDFTPREHRVLSYERPFGVGYLVAAFHRAPAAAEGAAALGIETDATFAALPSIAREAVRAKLEKRKYEAPPVEGALAARAAVFVTLRHRESGELRGCIGSLSPGTADVVHETIDRAIAAALHDPRFPAVRAEELDELVFDVNVLGAPEPIDGPEQLDPATYGVVVSDRAGRRGVLLPRIEGIESVDQQVEIARRKAGIAAGAEVVLERFQTRELHEAAEGPR